MKILLVGATGTIGKAITQAIGSRHEIVPVSRHGAHPADVADPASIARMLRAIGRVDAIVCAAGEARFGPLAGLSDDDFRLSLTSKLMGQVNLVRLGAEHVVDGGSITLTSGVLAQAPMVGSAAISLVNAGIEGFVRAAALEMPRGIRVNVVSPNWVTETLRVLGMDPTHGTPAAVVARAYVQSLEGSATGAVIGTPAP